MNDLFLIPVIFISLINSIKLKVSAHNSINGKYELENKLDIDERAKYRVVMVRHGQSEANLVNQFGGWSNYNLTEKGREQAKRAGITLKKQGYKFDTAHTSFLRRAFETMEIILEVLGQSTIEKYETWRLNERHLGLFIGMNRVEANEKYGEEQVRKWRRSYDIRPPPMPTDHPFYKEITEDPRYRQDPDFIDFPSSECLKDVIDRVIPYWEKVITPQIEKGKQVLIVGHSSLFRAIVHHFENLTDSQLLTFKIPNAKPFFYEFDEDIKPIIPHKFIPTVPDT